MVFVRWQATPKLKSRPDVKISRTTIQISPEAVSQFQIAGDEKVNLFFDGQRQMIGIAPTTVEDIDGVPLKFNARTGFATVAAKLFFSTLSLDGAKASDGNLRIVDGVMAFDVNLPTTTHYGFTNADQPKGRVKGGAPKQRRRRRTRAELEATRAAK